MRIVIANKYYYPRGGDCQYMLRLKQLLEDNGHEVAPFSMHHPDNLQSEYDRYFVEHIDFREELQKMNPAAVVRVSTRSVINRNAVKLFRRLIDDFKPNIIHLQNIHHQLTPAIIGPAVQKSIPIVWTLHDYNLLCPDHTFLYNDHICQKCSSGKYYHAIVNRCKKGSLGASFLAALECAIHNPWRLSKYVNKFICPSSFMARLMIESGIPPNQIAHVPLFLPDSDYPACGGDYFLYAGRLSTEKGIKTLLEAIRRLPNVRFVIIGDGPSKNEFDYFIETNRLENAESIGYQPPEKVKKYMAGCLAMILPSIWFENLPYSIMEAMACAKPVIASNIGGIPEMVEHGVNGLLCEPGNVDSLVDCINRLAADRGLAIEMGSKGADKFRRYYTAENHYQNIIKIYNDALDNNNVISCANQKKGESRAITQLG